MREIIKAIIELQYQWTSENSDAMEKRGQLLRNDLPHKLQAALQDSPAPLNLVFKGSDGAGRKAAIPWVRVALANDGKRIPNSWYLVYLFGKGTDQVHLALLHDSSTKRKGGFTNKVLSHLTVQAQAARQFLELDTEDLGLPFDLNVGSNSTGSTYAQATVSAITYKATHLPDNPTLVEDLAKMIEVMATLESELPYSELMAEAERVLTGPEFTGRPNKTGNSGSLTSSFEISDQGPLSVASTAWYAPPITEFVLKAIIRGESRGQRAEHKLQSEFGLWLQNQQRSVENIIISAGKTLIYPDLFDDTTQTVYEAKVSSSRNHVRTAIGQVLDYQHNLKRHGRTVNAAVLLPGTPERDLVELCSSLRIAVVVPKGDEFVTLNPESHA